MSIKMEGKSEIVESQAYMISYVHNFRLIHISTTEIYQHIEVIKYLSFQVTTTLSLNCMS